MPENPNTRFGQSQFYLLIANWALVCTAAALGAVIAIFIPGTTGKLWRALFTSVPIFFSLYLAWRALREYWRLERGRHGH